MLRLHCAPGTIAVVVAIAMEEARVGYETVLVDFKNAEQTKGPYHKINPKGRVPALETPDGILTETGAILEYVAPDLVPSDPLKAARMREVMYYLASTMHVNHAHKLRGARWADQEASWEDMRQKVPETVSASCAYLEEACSLSPFVLGDTISVADAYLSVVLRWVPADGVDLGNYPKLQAFADMMAARPSVQAAKKAGLF